MDIAVLLKQVPATDSIVTIAGDGVSIETQHLKWIVNPYDEFAVEEALRIKEAEGGAVTIVSVGTQTALQAIKTALAMGADRAILVDDPAAETCDALGIARILAALLKEVPFDLIIAGHRAVDDDNFQVGPAVAELLDIPHIPFVIDAEVTEGKIRCRRTVEGGTLLLETPLPALFTTQRGLNEPRLPSLPGIMQAKNKPLDVKTLSDIGLDPEPLLGPLVRVVGLRPSPERKSARIIEGETAEEKAAELVKTLSEEAKAI